MEYVTLNNGVRMPMLGFGVWQVPPRATERHVRVPAPKPGRRRRQR